MIWGVVTLTFFVSRVVSPDPTNLLVPPQADAATRAVVRAHLGLDHSLAVQYSNFLVNLLRGDLGTSFITNQPVTRDLLDRLPATLELGLVSVVWGVVLGIALGIISALRVGSFLDQGLRGLIVCGMAMPQFWLGLMLIWIFFLRLGWLPGAIGRLPIDVAAPTSITGFYLVDSLLTGNMPAFVATVRQLVLPSVTLGFGIFAPIARVARTSMVEALSSDYVRTARALGYQPHRINMRFALKNAMLPIITMSANAVAFAFSGAVLVEGIFAWPGIGQYALNAIQQSDFPALQGFVIYVAILYVLIYLCVDLLYAAVDPRLKR